MVLLGNGEFMYPYQPYTNACICIGAFLDFMYKPLKRNLNKVVMFQHTIHAFP